MIKMRISIGITMLLVVALAVWGYSHKDSITDVTSESNYLNSMMIAEIPEEFALADCKNLVNDLPSIKYIFRVTPSGEYEQLFSIGQQRVIVKEIYEGQDVAQGQEIILTTRDWTLFLLDGNRYIERGFINILKKDADYLVFCSEEIKIRKCDTKVFRIYEESYITPVFCYDNFENRIIEPFGETTYVPYVDVKDNEFFACTEVAMRAWSELKSQMLELYPKGK